MSAIRDRGATVAARAARRALNRYASSDVQLSPAESAGLVQEIAHEHGCHMATSHAAFFIYPDRRSTEIIVCLRRPGARRFKLYALGEVAAGP
jgi:hypothetical protein